MLIYLTFNDQPSGVYKGQVIDVVSLYRNELNKDIRLIAFISLRKFFKNQSWIKELDKSAIVLPMFPGLKNWKLNSFTLKLLFLFLKIRLVIARGPMACQIAHSAISSSKVIYDGRGAVKAEIEEYDVITDSSLQKEIIEAERISVLNSSRRLAVSMKLVEYWREEFNYSENSNIVIPCSVSFGLDNLSAELEEELTRRIKCEFDLRETDVLIVYSGSTQGWQSFKRVRSFLEQVLRTDDKFKILFLSPEDESIESLILSNPTRVFRRWVGHNEVGLYLKFADYGVLMRDKSITNKVASPTKFAEYLIAGLKVLITPEVGDFSDFVQENDCGHVVHLDGTGLPYLESVELSEKQRISELALLNYSKKSKFIRQKYLDLVS